MQQIPINWKVNPLFRRLAHREAVPAWLLRLIPLEAIVGVEIKKLREDYSEQNDSNVDLLPIHFYDSR